MSKFYKETVGERQMFRRIANEFKNTIIDSLKNTISNIDQFPSSCPSDLCSENVGDCGINTQDQDSDNDIEDNINHLSGNEEPNSDNINMKSKDNKLIISSDQINCFDKVSTPYDLHNNIKKWAIRNKVPHSTVTDLLHVLSPIHPELPLSSKTLLRTPTSIKHKKELHTGTYIHFGLRHFLEMYLSRHFLLFSDIIQISFNIDGLPLFKSSSIQFWPILGLIVNASEKLKPFAIGVFCGKSKPNPLNEYLMDFIEELKTLLEEGISVTNKKYKIVIHSFICDAPARAFIKCIKTHSGYSGCDKCIEEGDYYKHRLIFNNISATRRTDESFLLKADQNHHAGVSPLEELNIGMISKFPIDSMHCIFLGVMKKLLITWTTGDLRVRFCSRDVTKISEALLSCRQFFVSEFNRKPRSLTELPRFKATEFRSFLIYSGVLVLRHSDKAIYEHFLLLHFAVSILSSKNHLEKFGCNVIKKLLDCFITHSISLYGLEFLVYNVHVLCHLSEEAQLFGPLNQISAFPFENFLGEIKGLINSPNKPLEQLFRRISEANNVSLLTDTGTNNNNKCYLPHFNGPLLNLPGNIILQYKKLKYNNFLFTISNYSTVNCYCLYSQHFVIKINNIIVDDDNNIFLIGQRFANYTSFYTYPFDSKSIDICVVSVLEPIQIFPLDRQVSKCMLFPLDSPETTKWLSFPLLT